MDRALQPVNWLPAHDDRLPLYQRLRDELMRRVGSGEWAPGDAIPTEAELTRSYGVATGTVRKSIEMLVADGLLVRHQGKGTFVRRPSFDSSLFRFFRFKSRNGAAVLPTARILGRALRAPPAEVRRALALREGEEGIVLTRVREVEDRTVLAEDIWLPRRPFEALAQMKLQDFDDLLYPFYERSCGQRVASAHEKLVVESASRSLAARLHLEPGAAVIAVQRTAFDLAGKPLEWRCTRGAAALFQYEVDIR